MYSCLVTFEKRVPRHLIDKLDQSCNGLLLQVADCAYVLCHNSREAIDISYIIQTMFGNGYKHFICNIDGWAGVHSKKVITAVEELIKGHPPAPDIKYFQASRDLPKNATANATAKDFESIVAELKDMGIKSLADYLESVEAAQKMRDLLIKANLPAGEAPNYHLLAVGDPGTGKTTSIRRYAEALKHLGVLSKGHMVETDRADLVGPYIGQTEPKTTGKLDEAAGGVLFIDEAHLLVNGSSNDFGPIALGLIAKRMEDARGDLVVVMAGTPDKMDSFLNMNSGLRSRFAAEIKFAGYSDSELDRIARKMMAQSTLSPCDDFTEIFSAIARDVRGRDQHKFGNARFARNLVQALDREVSGRLKRSGQIDQLLKSGLGELELQVVISTLRQIQSEDLWRVAERECGVPRSKIQPGRCNAVLNEKVVPFRRREMQ